MENDLLLDAITNMGRNSVYVTHNNWFELIAIIGGPLSLLLLLITVFLLGRERSRNREKDAELWISDNEVEEAWNREENINH